jgi:hypothetical protein
MKKKNPRTYCTPISPLPHTVVPYPCKQKPYCQPLAFPVLVQEHLGCYKSNSNLGVMCAMVRSWCAWRNAAIGLFLCNEDVQCCGQSSCKSKMVISNSIDQLKTTKFHISYLQRVKIGFHDQHRISATY